MSKINIDPIALSKLLDNHSRLVAIQIKEEYNPDDFKFTKVEYRKEVDKCRLN